MQAYQGNAKTDSPLDRLINAVAGVSLKEVQPVQQQRLVRGLRKLQVLADEMGRL